MSALVARLLTASLMAIALLAIFYKVLTADHEPVDPRSGYRRVPDEHLSSRELEERYMDDPPNRK